MCDMHRLAADKVDQSSHHEHCDALAVKSPKMSLSCALLVGEMGHPSLLDCLGSGPLGLKYLAYSNLFLSKNIFSYLIQK